MTYFKSYRSASLLLCLGTTLVAGLAAGCGVELRPSVPTLRARAVISPATLSAESVPASQAPPTYQPAEPAYASSPPPMEVASASQYAQSGGASVATAEVISVGATLLGRVAKNAPRYYVVDLSIGDTLDMTAYMRVLAGDGRFVVTVIEPDEVQLSQLTNYVLQSTEWERKTRRVAAKQAGRHLIRVASDSATDYKLLISGATLAAK